MTRREHDDEHNWPIRSGWPSEDSARLSRVERMLKILLWRSGVDHELEIKLMADLSKLNADVSKLSDLAVSFKTMTDGLKAQRDALQAEVDTLKAADATDQAAVDAAEAKLAEVTAALEAVTAVAAGTPVDPGGSTGGITA